ncbi:MAG: phage baseplate assembly protein V [Lachnospiraceae bacterium]|nr:phage baseplate assembly protein V [Lachnospiraceae bacterium]
MREVRIMVEPFEFISIAEFQCKKEINEHGCIEIKGMVSEKNARKYQNSSEKETWVTVKLRDEEGEDNIFFNGIITNLLIEKENLVHMLSFTAKTGSYLLDLALHRRSFQRESYTYDEILENCLTPDKGKFIMLEKKGDKINRFLMQYKETDWEFIKRLSSYAETVIMPEFSITGRKLYFGFKKENKKHEIITNNYRIIQNDEQVLYEVESREAYSLGDIVTFRGKELVIGRIMSRLSGQELKHIYTFQAKAAGVRHEKGNQKLAGISLKANVTGVNKTRVSIRIQDDENKNDSGSRWFDFATVYSTPDGTGWYCMPEVGDEVRVNFPDREEEHAYVASCVHLNNNNRENPDEKSWKNKQGKEILFTPEALIFRNNKGMSIEINDSEGIKVISDKKIILQADQAINISSGTEMRISALDSMLLSQGGASIQMDDTINISGGKIYMN